MTNPLLTAWTTEFELPPFDLITDEDFGPAFEAAFAEARANINAIADQSEAPSFDNTIRALEVSENLLERVAAVFFNLAGSNSNPALEALQRELSPKFAAFSSETMQNEALFQRIETLFAARDTLDLTPEQDRVLFLYHRSFTRSGAALPPEGKARLAKVTERLAVLGTAFTQNLLKDERDWSMPLDEATLNALPGFLAEAAKSAGAERGAEGAVMTLSRSLIVPFLQFCPDRELRRTAYEAWSARGENGGESDNRDIVRETLALREERASLLGYETFADFKLAPEMAGSPEKVRDLLTAVWTPAKAAAERDGEILAGMLAEDGINGPLEPWDWRYYSEKRRLAEHDLDEAELKPYFPLEGMIRAAFDCATRLFGVTFHALDVPLYHADARAWEVRSSTGDHVAVFIGDYFARPSKRSGAWCSRFRAQSKLEDASSITVNVCNFAKAPKGRPSLLTFDDARTLFHEFGHALHSMLSDVTYPTVSGTSVARDFVELPSQLFEHWMTVPDVLQTFARHAETGAAIPEDMLKRLLAASNYDSGFSTVEYVASAMVDLAFHEGPAPADPMARQAEVLAEIGLPHAIRMRHATPHFAHVFSGDGYSSSYYSYMWSEVMDADAFEAFKETGDPFDPAMAAKLHDHIFSAGGTKDAEALYLAFRGKMPGVEALLRGRGLVESI